MKRGISSGPWAHSKYHYWIFPRVRWSLLGWPFIWTAERLYPKSVWPSLYVTQWKSNFLEAWQKFLWAMPKGQQRHPTLLWIKAHKHIIVHTQTSPGNDDKETLGLWRQKVTSFIASRWGDSPFSVILWPWLLFSTIVTIKVVNERAIFFPRIILMDIGHDESSDLAERSFSLSHSGFDLIVSECLYVEIDPCLEPLIVEVQIYLLTHLRSSSCMEVPVKK